MRPPAPDHHLPAHLAARPRPAHAPGWRATCLPRHCPPPPGAGAVAVCEPCSGRGGGRRGAGRSARLSQQARAARVRGVEGQLPLPPPQLALPPPACLSSSPAPSPALPSCLQHRHILLSAPWLLPPRAAAPHCGAVQGVPCVFGQAAGALGLGVAWMLLRLCWAALRPARHATCCARLCPTAKQTQDYCKSAIGFGVVILLLVKLGSG